MSRKRDSKSRKRDAARERLELLLKWVNNRDSQAFSTTDVLQRLRQYVRSFDGEPVHAGTQVNMRPDEWGIVATRDGEQLPADIAGLEGLASMLHGLLSGDMDVAFPSLRFHVEVDPSYGFNEVTVNGLLSHVVLYLTMRLVVDDFVQLGRCQAPVPNSPGVPTPDDYEECGKVYVVGKRGPTCSDRCRQRTKKNRPFQRRQDRQRRAAARKR